MQWRWTCQTHSRCDSAVVKVTCGHVIWCKYLACTRRFIFPSSCKQSKFSTVLLALWGQVREKVQQWEALIWEMKLHCHSYIKSLLCSGCQWIKGQKFVNPSIQKNEITHKSWCLWIYLWSIISQISWKKIFSFLNISELLQERTKNVKLLHL